MIYEEYDFLNNNWFNVCHSIFSASLPKKYDDYWKKLQKMTRILEYFHTNPNELGTPFTIDDMVINIYNRCILNCDGTGDFINYDTFESEEISDIENIKKLKERTDTDFILWYNK